MDQNQHLTKKDLKALRKMERMEQEKMGKGGDSSKLIIMAIAAVAFLAFFGFIIFTIKQSKNKPIAISAAGWTKGGATASATLVEFGDFQCPACKAYEPIVRQVYKDFKGKVKIHFKHFPLVSAHPNAMLGSIAAEAAGRQDKFWEMHDWLYDNQDSWALLPGVEAKAKIVSAAKELKLDVAKFEKDLDDKSIEKTISENQSEGIELGVVGTPTFFVNNKRVEKNPQSVEEFKKLIEESMK